MPYFLLLFVNLIWSNKTVIYTNSYSYFVKTKAWWRKGRFIKLIHMKIVTKPPTVFFRWPTWLEHFLPVCFYAFIETSEQAAFSDCYCFQLCLLASVFKSLGTISAKVSRYISCWKKSWKGCSKNCHINIKMVFQDRYLVKKNGYDVSGNRNLFHPANTVKYFKNLHCIFGWRVNIITQPCSLFVSTQCSCSCREHKEM